MKQKTKVCYVLSYRDPKYVRTKFLIQSLENISGVELVTAINRITNPLRYIETILRLVLARLIHRPDVYVLGFRGVEMYWVVKLITIGKPLIYDEFINPYLWFVEEHEKVSSKNYLARLIYSYTKLVLNNADLVLSDTNAHADYSSNKFSLPRSKFSTLYVGADESMFNAPANTVKKPEKDVFKVFFYGNFYPLHGLEYIVEAANILKDYPGIEFTIVGGANRKKDMSKFLDSIAELGLTNIKHKPWLPLEELPAYISRSDLCLGGPFGDTPQSRKVITGKTYQFLAMAKPTVIGYVDEEVGFKDQYNCLLIKQGSGELLAEKIKWAFDNQDQLANIGRQGKDLYEQTFSQSAQQHKLEEAIELSL